MQTEEALTHNNSVTADDGLTLFVYAMDPSPDYWVDVSPHHAVSNYRKFAIDEMGYAESECDVNANVLLAQELDTLQFFNEDADEGEPEKMPFRQALENMVRKGDAPGFFASSEY